MRALVGLCAIPVVLITSAVLAPAAHADPSPDPCQLAVSLFCRFIPMAPDLDHTIDLTQNQPPAAPPENPADPRYLHLRLRVIWSPLQLLRMVAATLELLERQFLDAVKRIALSHRSIIMSAVDHNREAVVDRPMCGLLGLCTASRSLSRW